MARDNFHAVLKRMTAAVRPMDGDAELLDRFARDRDQVAFAELVRRYGRLVWAQCRNLLPTEADAEDALQATFLTLARSAGTVRDGSRLGPWLHGVAYRVCLNARRAAARRKRREHAAATAEAERPVADSAWDAALAAVHEEVCRLPESLRVPFVLCCLEGKGVTEAAAQLGWKLGTLSARLTRAKQTLIDRLTGRGLPAAVAGAVAVTGGAASAEVPAALAARTADLAVTAGQVSPTILYLTHGVTNMTVYRTKLLAAALLMGGLATGVGSGWLTTNAGAQQPEKPVEPPVRNSAVLPGFPYPLELVAGEITFTTNQPAARWEFCYYVPKGPLTVPQFEAAVAKYSDQFKAEFVGTARMSTAEMGKLGQRVAADDPKTLGPQQVVEVLVFKRAAQPVIQGGTVTLSGTGLTELRVGEALLNAATLEMNLPAQPGPEANRAKALENQIKFYQAQLDQLRAKTRKNVTIPAPEVGIDPQEMMTFLGKLAAKRFGPGYRERLELSSSSKGLEIHGDAEVVEWAVGVVRKLNEK